MQGTWLACGHSSDWLVAVKSNILLVHISLGPMFFWLAYNLISSMWWKFGYLQNSSKDMVYNIIYKPWGGTKAPWLCLMAKSLFCLVWLFLHFLTSLIKFIFWTWGRPGKLKFFCEEAGRGHSGQRRQSVSERPHKVVLGYKH